MITFTICLFIFCLVGFGFMLGYYAETHDTIIRRLLLKLYGFEFIKIIKRNYGLEFDIGDFIEDSLGTYKVVLVGTKISRHAEVWRKLAHKKEVIADVK